jgi:hypothetical protein
MIREIDNTSDPYVNLLEEKKEAVRSFSAKGIFRDNGSMKTATSQDKLLFTKEMKRVHGEVVAPFNNGLTINSSEIKVIQDIIHYLDSRSTMALGLPSNQRHLKEEGKKIDHVHPLCFIWAIIKEASLRDKLRAFRDNSAFSLKWNGFMGYSTFHDKGFGKNLERYYNHRNPAEYEHEFKNFCQVLRLKEEKIMPHVMIKSWRGFASALVDESSYF